MQNTCTPIGQVWTMGPIGYAFQLTDTEGQNTAQIYRDGTLVWSREVSRVEMLPDAIVLYAWAYRDLAEGRLNSEVARIKEQAVVIHDLPNKYLARFSLRLLGRKTAMVGTQCYLTYGAELIVPVRLVLEVALSLAARHWHTA